MTTHSDHNDYHHVLELLLQGRDACHGPGESIQRARAPPCGPRSLEPAAHRKPETAKCTSKTVSPPPSSSSRGARAPSVSSPAPPALQ
eukprot:11612976-Alexandrium_andersonii.AAC.1